MLRILFIYLINVLPIVFLQSLCYLSCVIAKVSVHLAYVLLVFTEICLNARKWKWRHKNWITPISFFEVFHCTRSLQHLCQFVLILVTSSRLSYRVSSGVMCTCVLQCSYLWLCKFPYKYRCFWVTKFFKNCLSRVLVVCYTSGLQSLSQASEGCLFTLQSFQEMTVTFLACVLIWVWWNRYKCLVLVLQVASRQVKANMHNNLSKACSVPSVT